MKDYSSINSDTPVGSLRVNVRDLVVDQLQYMEIYDEDPDNKNNAPHIREVLFKETQRTLTPTEKKGFSKEDLSLLEKWEKVSNDLVKQGVPTKGLRGAFDEIFNAENKRMDQWKKTSQELISKGASAKEFKAAYEGIFAPEKQAEISEDIYDKVFPDSPTMDSPAFKERMSDRLTILKVGKPSKSKKESEEPVFDR